MKKLLLILIASFSFAQEYTTDKPAKSAEQEDKVIVENKCIRWLFLSEYYTYRAIETESVYFTKKANEFTKLYKENKCINDDYKRFKLLKNRWYIKK